MNFGGPRGPYPAHFNPGTPPSGRFRGMYQQSPPPNFGMPLRGGYNREKAVTFMPNDVKIPKPPKQPDKPLPAYMRYSRKVWETVKMQNPDMKMWDIGKLIGEQWRNLPEDERQGFFAEYEVEKIEYQEAMKNYHNSNAYRDWLKAKEKAQNALQEQQMMEKMMGGSLPKEEPRFQLQQIEDDDDDTEFSIKHVAASRFQRNHRLISEIFSEATVPDIKTIVTKPRLDNLKKQVQSLMQHQRKLESEIEDMEEKFTAKKQKILDKSQEFEENIRKLSEEHLSETSSDVKRPDETEMSETKFEATDCDVAEVKMDVENSSVDVEPAAKMLKLEEGEKETDKPGDTPAPIVNNNSTDNTTSEQPNAEIHSPSVNQSDSLTPDQAETPVATSS